MEFEVGKIIQRAEKDVLVTRIVDSKSFFEDAETKKCYILDELYVQTLDEKGEIGFIALREERHPATRDPESKIDGPDTLEWRKLLYQGEE